MITAIKEARTADGATVDQTFVYAERLRPKKFKLREIISTYDSKGNYTGFSACYFIGLKRLEGDDYCQISFSVDRQTLAVKPEIHSKNPDFSAFTSALMAGRDAFVAAVDDAYRRDCIDPVAKSKSC